MIEFTQILQEIGRLSLGTFWFPLLIWSACALLIHRALQWMQKGDVLYHYYLRVALVAGIPLGICASSLATYVADLFSTPAPALLITVQNPITVMPATGSAAASVNWGDPYLWIGMITMALLLVGFLQLGRLVWNYYQIYRYAQTLDCVSIHRSNFFKEEEQAFLKSFNPNTYLAFSEETEIPFTFGWFHPVIVIPSFLKNEPAKLRMAVRHELMHIKRGDFLVNGFIIAMKSLLWFHPLIHYFDNEIREYREISCDSEVLIDRTISRKQYAQLLFELAPKHENYSHGIVSMSVNKSTLQKRIKTMKTLAKDTRPVTKSLIFSFVLLVSISGIIACSDLQDNGITSTEIEQAQADLQNLEGEEKPLFVIREDTDLDGSFDSEEIASKKQGEKINLIKNKYIQSMEVYRGEKAIQMYGQKASNGVAIINLLNKEKAFSDLKDPGQTIQEEAPSEPFFVVVEQMPKLIGGLESIQNCVQYPEMARKAGIEGRVIVRFIVNEQGSVENPEVIRGIGGGADKESIRCVKQAEFKPGKQRGEPVRVQYSLPVVYKLPGSVNEESSSVYMEMPKLEGRDIALESFSPIENGTISGKLVDRETDEPIAGANIVVEGTSVGTSTNTEGKFTLDRIPAGDQELSISHVQYDMMTLKVEAN